MNEIEDWHEKSSLLNVQMQWLKLKWCYNWNVLTMIINVHYEDKRSTRVEKLKKKGIALTYIIFMT